MTDLTILIPSIGRKTIFESIKSVDIDAEIHVLTSGEITSEVKSRLTYDQRIKYTHSINRLTAGKAKQTLINQVKTKYFLILDDDDVLTPGFLESALGKLDEYHHWILTGFDFNPHPTHYSFFEINSMELLYERMFEYDKYSEDYVKYHLYPNSSCIIDTELFRKLGENFRLSYGDDVVPILNLIMHSNGYYCCNGCITQNSDQSVSRNQVSYEKLYPVIESITLKVMQSKSQLEAKIWNRAYSNLMLRINHMNRKYGDK